MNYKEINESCEDEFCPIALIVMIQQAFFKYIFKPGGYPVGSKHVQFLREHVFLIVKWLCCTALFIISLLKHFANKVMQRGEEYVNCLKDCRFLKNSNVLSYIVRKTLRYVWLRSERYRLGRD
jgi:hypothetical protein